MVVIKIIINQAVDVLKAPTNDDCGKIVKLLTTHGREERIFQDENKNDSINENSDVSPREERVVMSG